MADLPDEEVLAKSGSELFQEFKRVYAEADIDDYYKNGLWKDDLLKLDYKLMVAHRSEAGAPEPPALKDIVKPLQLPCRERLERVPSAHNSSGAQDLKELATFVGQFKLDAARSRALMYAQPVPKRRYVYANFSCLETGEEAFRKLEAYIQEQELMAWAAMPVPEVPPAPAPAPAAVSQQLSKAAVSKSAAVAAVPPAGVSKAASVGAVPGNGFMGVASPPPAANLAPASAKRMAAAPLPAMDAKIPRMSPPAMSPPPMSGMGKDMGGMKGMDKGFDKGGWDKGFDKGGWGMKGMDKGGGCMKGKGFDKGFGKGKDGGWGKAGKGGKWGW
eukprot:TRINITY_DN123551_c0_g1_i1.p1 TRINITY_DN123551_c0_g1~~TRINITY_DN123551_c0_g1_i1.p1  ORF type:complete len:330 (-),score=73.14 TRINITY_DN123551_c0_g1_i1:390-1379(-)